MITNITDEGGAPQKRWALEVTIREISPERALQHSAVLVFSSWADYRAWLATSGLTGVEAT